MKPERPALGRATAQPAGHAFPTARPLAWPAALCALLLLAACATEPVATVPRAVAMGASTCTQPPYPAEAKLDEAQGSTQLEFEVNPLGKVTRVVIVKLSGNGPGHKLLDALALETLSKCSFPPAPGFLSATSRVEFVWRLKD